MTASDFIQENIGLPLPDLLVKYHHYREKNIPYDRDVWKKARQLDEKEFCVWLFEEITRVKG